MLYRDQNLNYLLEVDKQLKSKTALDKAFASEFNAFRVEAEHLCCLYVLSYFSKSLGNLGGFTCNKPGFIASLSVIDDFHKFIDYMLYLLEKNDFVEVHDNVIYFSRDIDDRLLGAQQASCNLKNKFPKFSGELDFLDYCVEHYSEALSGKIPSISVLYPNGSTELIEKMLGRVASTDAGLISVEKLYLEWLVSVVKKQNLSILEFGAGRGLLAWNTLDAVCTEKIYYNFTDIGIKFVMDAERTYKAKGCSYPMKFQRFDITKSYSSQGFSASSFDIVVGMNVLHTVADIDSSVTNLKALVRSGGYLCLLETVETYPWIALTMGLTKGWWLFSDKQRALSPLLCSEDWLDVYRKAGFIEFFSTTGLMGDAMLAVGVV